MQTSSREHTSTLPMNPSLHKHALGRAEPSGDVLLLGHAVQFCPDPKKPELQSQWCVPGPVCVHMEFTEQSSSSEVHGLADTQT